MTYPVIAYQVDYDFLAFCEKLAIKTCYFIYLSEILTILIESILSNTTYAFDLSEKRYWFDLIVFVILSIIVTPLQLVSMILNSYKTENFRIQVKIQKKQDIEKESLLGVEYVEKKTKQDDEKESLLEGEYVEIELGSRRMRNVQWK